MVKHPLFEVVNGKAKITDHTRTIWFYNDIIEQRGEDLACKIFVVLHYIADLTLENPYHEVSEVEKLETIIRGCCPELPLDIDWNTYEMQEAIEFTRIQYETGSYRHYLANKTLLDKITKTVLYTHVDSSKESGNAGEIKKLNELFSTTRETTKKVYEEFLDEQGTVQVRGQGKKSSNRRNGGGREKELE